MAITHNGKWVLIYYDFNQDCYLLPRFSTIQELEQYTVDNDIFDFMITLFYKESQR